MLLCYLCLDIIKGVCILYCVTDPDPTLKNVDPDPMSLQYINEISNNVPKDVNDQPEEKEEQNSFQFARNFFTSDMLNPLLFDAE